MVITNITVTFYFLEGWKTRTFWFLFNSLFQCFNVFNVASTHIPLLRLHPPESSCQNRVQRLQSFDFHVTSGAPETLPGVFVGKIDEGLLI